MNKNIEQESHYITLGADSLYVKRLFTNKSGPPIFMLHGSMENGKIFYSKSMKGLGPYLAQRGYDVFVADLSGRGKSLPKVNAQSINSQTSAILEEIPAFKEFIQQLKGNVSQHWIAHSWGGVLMLAYVARFGGQGIDSMSFFGTKRRINVIHAERVFKVDIVWNLIGKIISSLYGYFPAKNLKIGSDNEPKIYYREVVNWVYRKKWKDIFDGFNYNEAFKKVEVPPTLYLAGKNDTFLGHPADVKKLMAEVNSENDQFILLSKKSGHLHDYDHINILTHPDAHKDQFPLVINWIEKQG